jgi:hypothetical protein
MINPIYTKPKTIAQLQHLFQENKQLPSIQLHNFFTTEEYSHINSVISTARFTHTQKPLLYSYSTTKTQKEIIPYLKEIKKISQQIIQHKLIKINIQIPQIIQLGHKDYTLLNDKNLQPQGYDIIFDLTDNWQPEFGGNLTYTNSNNQSFTITSKPNTLTIVERSDLFQKYIEYINHYAQKNKRYILMLSS